MPCIFSFGIHKEFFPCDLVNKKESLDELICNKCDVIMKLEYERFAKKQDRWDGDYLDFLHVFIEDRLKILETRFLEHEEFCDCGIGDEKYDLAKEKFQEMCDSYFDQEESRLEAKIDSGQLDKRPQDCICSND